MVDRVRNIEMAFGNGVKEPTESELKNIMIGRKSIVAKRNIEVGEVLNDSNITTKRPATGISAADWDKVIGTKAVRSYKLDDQI